MRALVFLVAAPAALAAQSVTGRVVDSATHHPLAHVTMQLIPGADSARDTVLAAAETADDGVFLLIAPGPGTYRVRIGARQLGPPLVLATADAQDAHEYLVRAAPATPAVDAYHVLYGAELDAALRSGRPLLECQVQKQAAMVPGTMQPQFPRMLAGLAPSGSLVAQFVVDTSGRAELATLTVWASPTTRSEFGVSARDALSRARFYPAESGGRKVRQVVQLPMTFQIVGQADPVPLPKTQCAPLGGELR